MTCGKMVVSFHLEAGRWVAMHMPDGTEWVWWVVMDGMGSDELRTERFVSDASSMVWRC